MSNENNLSLWDLFSEVMFQSCEVVEFIDDSLSTRELSELRFEYMTVHLVKPRVNQLGKMIGSVTTQSRFFMKDCESKLSNTETSREHITRKVHNFCMQTVSTTSHKVEFMMNELTFYYKNQKALQLDMYQWDRHYSISLINVGGQYEFLNKSGYYENGEKLNCFLDASDMVKWLVDNLTPRVLACMTLKDASASGV